ncbi:class I SAM-dependent methyltransferase [Tessaracoccus coleopterorum]|uniref:class I SAM-dependent methyltransferase n=1 Tax=Tessaracoccus coleopterorum TaxID=2714950 RepID=UPI002F909851
MLDLGCGVGTIAVGLALASPEVCVDAVDVNERAVQLTNLNAARHAVADRVHALTPDAVPTDRRYDEIWSNPPIRIGKDALHELLLTWLARLNPGGCAYLVVGRNLGGDSLQRWLTDQGHPTERLASAKGFRVLRANKLK